MLSGRSAAVLVRLCFAASAVALGGCDVSGVVGSRWLASASIAPASGGALAVSAAESPSFAGTSIAFQPGGLAEATTIGIAPSASLAAGDWVAAGPAVEWDPADAQLPAPATFAIPAALPAGRDPDDLLLLTGDPDALLYFSPGMQFDGTLLHFTSTRLGTFQAVLGKACSGRDGCASGDSCVRGYCRPGGDFVR